MEKVNMIEEIEIVVQGDIVKEIAELKIQTHNNQMMSAQMAKDLYGRLGQRNPFGG